MAMAGFPVRFPVINGYLHGVVPSVIAAAPAFFLDYAVTLLLASFCSRPIVDYAFRRSANGRPTLFVLTSVAYGFMAIGFLGSVLLLN
jgi:nitric oxide reductase large subunit